MPRYRIPFNKPGLRGRELRYIAAAIKRGHISGDGWFTRKCQTRLESMLGVRKALLTTSCTHALELAALLLDIRPGDEVIVPSYGFVSTANAFVLRGARPVFGDVRADTLNLDERRLDRLITSRTKAIVPIHYGGTACAMDEILALARRRGVAVVEDNAHGLFGSYKGRPLGSLGSLAALSFHETKNITCGEGGALLVNDARFIERAEIIREKGTDRSRYFRGQVDKYTWRDLGSSYAPSDILAAFLSAQLESAGQIQRRRRRIWLRYRAGLGDWARERGVLLPVVPPGCESAHHLFHLLLPSLKVRRALIEHLRRRGILAVFHFLPLHLSEMGRKFGGKPGDCPVSEDAGERVLRLPFYNDLSAAEQQRVIDAVTRFVW